MSSVMNWLSLKQKLILFASIPMLLLTLFGSMGMLHLSDSYQSAQKNSLAIEITQKVENLIFELQKERGLSAGYIGSAGDKYQKRLTAQRTDTDQHLAQLLTGQAIEQLYRAMKEEQNKISPLQDSLNQIKTMSHEIISVREDVTRKLEKESFHFYSEFNHQLLIFISQLQQQTEDVPQARAYNDLLNVLMIQELAGKERGLMNHLLSANLMEASAYISIHTIEHELDNAVSQLLSTATDENKLLIKELLASSSNLDYLVMRQHVKTQIEVIEQAQEMSVSMGYGGLIHDFKNYLLRGEQEYLDSFNRNLKQINFQLVRLKQHSDLTDSQHSAIEQIAETVNDYRIQIEQLRLLKRQGITIQEQDSRVRINDEPMLNALSLLQYQAPSVDSEEWWQVASERISHLHRVSSVITAEIAKLCSQQKNLAIIYLVIGLLTALFTTFLLLLLGRSMMRNLVGSIASIARDMQKMAHDPHLELMVPVRGNDEIAQMSQALNLMLKERLKVNRQLSLAAAVFDYSAEGIMVTDRDNHIELINPAFTQITGYTLDDVKGRNPSILNSNQQPHHFYDAMWKSLKEVDKWEGEIWNKRKDGQVYPEYLAITVVRDEAGEITHHIGLFLDISNRKKYEQDIWYKTNYDPLTNLANRHQYTLKIQQEMSVARQQSQQLAILFIDLDRFKYTNDIYGHSVGNELLCLVAARLESILGKHDFVARLSGDEFVIILSNVKHKSEVRQFVEGVINHLSSPFGLSNNELMISASVGVSLYPENGDDGELLTRNAETAMYQAKGDGRNSYRYFSADMNSNMLERVQLEQRLRRAVLQEEFCLFYQPIVDLTDRTIVGVEALIRWRDPKYGLISPDKFIPVAEETGLIEPIGEWVIQQALTDLNQWHAAGFKINMAINVSGRQLINSNQSSFSCLLSSMLQKHKIAPRYLHLEITESMLMDDTELCQQKLEAIRDLGVDIYIDDFGTGYSSLSYLKRFPISVIKIDKSFVDNMLERQSDANLIKAIVMMGQSLGLRLVAEGIETEEQWEFLQKLGCDFGQGYLISRPRPLNELSGLLVDNLKPAQELEQELCSAL
ncbi:EAL domain-containing protein [uncultured Shewanella sp.]|uniref:EAL domain-containing protein n=1 Tax=Shewanella atlantica TaxID=271099 RepID=UPI002618747E|nr:EAL domain-containing protein [uncultured Shewanella sp.]